MIDWIKTNWLNILWVIPMLILTIFVLSKAPAPLVNDNTSPADTVRLSLLEWDMDVVEANIIITDNNIRTLTKAINDHAQLVPPGTEGSAVSAIEDALGVIRGDITNLQTDAAIWNQQEVYRDNQFQQFNDTQGELETLVQYLSGNLTAHSDNITIHSWNGS